MPDAPTHLYLIGPSIEHFEDKLPRGIDVLRYYYHFEESDDTRRISETINQVQQIYQRAGISTIHLESIRSKLKRLVASVKTVIGTRKSESPTQMQKELAVFQKSHELFEIVKNEPSLAVMTRYFLEDQRNSRRMLVINQPSSSRVQNNHVQQTTSQLSTTSQEVEMFDQLESPHLSNLSDPEIYDTNDPNDSDSTAEFVPSYVDDKKVNKIQLCASDMKELSKCNGSYRVIEKVLSIGIKAAGGNPNDYAISKTSLCNQLNHLRSHSKSDVLEQAGTSDEKVIILFDGKKFAKINQKHIGKDSRLVVMCHTQTKDVPLGLPILDSGHAETYVNEMVDLCDNSDLLSRIAGIVCDTTAVNTGEKGGVCVRFENKIQREVLNLMCRHHIHEILLSTAFTNTFGGIEAPTIASFDFLKHEWQQIKGRGFEYVACDPSILESPHLRSFYELHSMKRPKKRYSIMRKTNLFVMIMQRSPTYA